jgi:hypothetical protein
MSDVGYGRSGGRSAYGVSGANPSQPPPEVFVIQLDEGEKNGSEEKPAKNVQNRTEI